ncbi:MAG: hypothetical protein V2A75_01845 [Pseudomonadota bacterium]
MIPSYAVDRITAEEGEKMFFQDCVECEIFILGMLFLAAVTIDYVFWNKREWGENSKDAKWSKR